MVYFSEMWILVVKIGHLTKWMIFYAIEQVFRRAFCVFWTVFKFLKLSAQINGVNSTIFLFSRFRQFFLDVVLCQNIQNIITFMVRWEFFPHLPMKVFHDPECANGPESHPQLRRQLCFTLFWVSSRDFGLRFQPKKWGTKQYFVNIC